MPLVCLSKLPISATRGSSFLPLPDALFVASSLRLSAALKIDSPKDVGIPPIGPAPRPRPPLLTPKSSPVGDSRAPSPPLLALWLPNPPPRSASAASRFEFWLASIVTVVDVPPDTKPTGLE